MHKIIVYFLLTATKKIFQKSWWHKPCNLFIKFSDQFFLQKIQTSDFGKILQLCIQYVSDGQWMVRLHQSGDDCTINLLSLEDCVFKWWKTFTFSLLILDLNIILHSNWYLLESSRQTVNDWCFSCGKNFLLHRLHVGLIIANISCCSWWVWFSNIIWGQFLGCLQANDSGKHNRPLPHWSLDN